MEKVVQCECGSKPAPSMGTGSWPRSGDTHGASSRCGALLVPGALAGKPDRQRIPLSSSGESSVAIDRTDVKTLRLVEAASSAKEEE